MKQKPTEGKGIKEVKKELMKARRKGWWIACFYWERKLEKLLIKSTDETTI